MNRVRCTNYVPRVTKTILRSLTSSTARAAELLCAELRKVVGEPYPPASTPGNPPHRRTGAGQSAIQVLHQPTFSQIIVADPGRHLIYLEYGTRRVAPRPWLRPTVLRMMPILSREFAVKGTT